VLLKISIPTGIVSPLAPFYVLHVLVLADCAFGIILTCGWICRGGDLQRWSRIFAQGVKWISA